MNRFDEDAVAESKGSVFSEEERIDKGMLLTTISITLFFMGYMFSSVNIALPAISRDFHAHVLDLSWVTSAIFLPTAIFLVPFGRLADIVGLKRIYTLGMVLYVLVNAVCAFSVSVGMLIVMRVLQGLSGAMVVGNTIALVTMVFPKGEKGKAMGIASAAVYVGLSCSPLISGFLTVHFGWRSLFLITVPAGLLVLALIFWKIKGEWRGARGESLDIVGTVVFGVAVTALMLGFSKLASPAGWMLIPAGILFMIVFVIWENRTRFPLIQVRLFRNNRVFVLSNISALLNYSATYSIIFFMSLYLQYVKGLNPTMAGLVLAVQPATQAILSPLTGRISDRIEPRIPASAGMGIICAGLASFAFLGQQTPVVTIVLTLVFLGVGFALFVPPNTNAVMSSVTPNVYGVASAIVNSMRNFGQVLSMGLAMMVLALIMGSVVVSPENVADFIASTRIAFALFSFLCFVGIFTSFSRGKVR